MALGIIFTALFASAFGIMYMFFTTRNRERMAMIEKGSSQELFKPQRVQEKTRRNYSAIKFSLKFGLFMIGLGFGFVVTVFLNNSIELGMRDLFAVGAVFICGGLGLVAGYFAGRMLDKKDNKNP